MRITDYELYEVPPRWQFLKLETSDGAVGWGEPYSKWHYQGDAPSATPAAVDQMMEKYVLGEDPARIEDLWQAMYRSSFYRGGPIHMSAIAGIDQALWDLKGKRFGAPVYELLGGPARDRVRAYQHVSVPSVEEVDDPAAAAAREAEGHVADGFRALKLVPTPGLELVDSPASVDAASEVVGAVREAVGAEVDVAVDFHGRASKTMARQLAAALEPHDPMFVEEPVTPEHDHALPRIVESTRLPIATGERLYTRSDFRPLFEADAVDVVQPDVSNAGGITETKKIADMAETYDVSVAPHCPMGPLCTAASLQIDAAVPNALVQEQILHKVEGAFRYVENPGMFDVVDGFIDVPEGPGLGVEIDGATVEEWDGRDLSFTRPLGRRADGSVGER
ncbi:galactonate dehydratase [Halosimplex aquaticum]|uniref:Galactonate dehydratase n=1 Tax=Halosimplex aquaticum TaxID=3026162 RepID=A0ABD5Y381_9EURY|nr:galactonate dehydratase [Halosimplex aquaticum]